MMKRSVITDEVSQSIPDVLAFARSFSLDAVELRSVEGKGPFEFDKTLVETLRTEFVQAGFPVCCLSLPFYKCAIDDLVARQSHIESLKRSLEHADRLGCGLVRGFCFWRDPSAPLPVLQVAEAYQAAIPLLQDANVTLVIEADPSVNGHTARDLKALIEGIDSPAVQALWDGGNLLYAVDGETPVDGYRLLRPYIRHVHIKDAVRIPGGADAVKVGQGEGQIAQQLSLLLKDGYDGYLSLETHYRLTKEIDEALMRLPGGAAFSEGALEASTESMEAFTQLYKEAVASCGR